MSDVKISKSDLMIGNWLSVPAVGYIQVDEIMTVGVMVRKGDYTFRYETVTPIPLDPTILEKCGFVKDWAGNFSLGSLHIYMHPKTNYWQIDTSIENEYKGSSDDREIHYLHQLQNLYFALTGSPLKIEL